MASTHEAHVSRELTNISTYSLSIHDDTRKIRQEVEWASKKLKELRDNNLQLNKELWITSLKGRLIYDSNGNHTVEVEVTTADVFRASVPSRQTYCLESQLYERSRLYKEVNDEVYVINKHLGPALIQQKFKYNQQYEFDTFLMNWDEPRLASAGSTLAISLAFAKAAAATEDVPLSRYFAEKAGNLKVSLPRPVFNIINGGSNAGNSLAIKGLSILPIGATTFTDAVYLGKTVYNKVKEINAGIMGYNGGLDLEIACTKKALQMIENAVVAVVGKEHKKNVKTEMNISASDFFRSGKYDLDFKNRGPEKALPLSTKDLHAFYVGCNSDQFIISIQDPFCKHDMGEWKELSVALMEKIQVVRSDLALSELADIRDLEKSFKCVTLKLEAIPTVTAAIVAHRSVKAKGLDTRLAYCYADTGDTSIVDMVVGLQIDQVEAGAPAGFERMNHYNQYRRVELEMELAGETTTYTSDRI